MLATAWINLGHALSESGWAQEAGWCATLLPGPVVAGLRGEARGKATLTRTGFFLEVTKVF